MKANKEIRLAMGATGVRQWQLAEALELSECYLSRKLRKELPGEEKEKILAVIEELGKENDA